MHLPAEKPNRRAVVEAVVASTIGTTIEWYDFFLVGVAATTVIDKLFFPNQSPFLAEMSAYGAFAVGFVARPFGGAVFGWMGDRIGRKSTLVTTLLLMGVSTLLMGLLPTFDQIGYWAPAALVLLRFVQGLGVGGEWGGAVLLALEYGHAGRRGFYSSWPQVGVPLGLISAIGIVKVLQLHLGEEAFLAWGWRIPFLLSTLLIGVGLVIRFRILETPLFAQLQESKQVAQTPVRETLRRHWREVLLAAGSRIGENACFYLFSIYVLKYVAHIGVDPQLAMTGVIIAGVLELFTMPAFGLISDAWSRKGVYVLGSLVLAGMALPYYALLHTRQDNLVLLAVILSLAIPHAMLYSVQASLIPELFGTRVRYTGASLGYQLGSPLGGGLAPMIAAYLVYKFPGEFWPLAQYLILIALISLGCVLLLAETSKKDLSAGESIIPPNKPEESAADLRIPARM
jgi:metabolite-proton symporter